RYPPHDLGLVVGLAGLALNHQSNGQIDPLSRSWNRVIGEMVFERGQFVTSIRAWSRIDGGDEDDDNPDIEDYMGRIQIGAAYRDERHTFAVGLKNNLRSDNRSGVELSWMFPVAEHLKGYVQVYSGYGENLIDAENYTNRVGVGISLTDWL
ncbi:MAG: phospholipase A, partial [Pseudomonadota bacterium]